MELPPEAVTADSSGSVLLELLIQPGASRTAVAGGLDGRIKIQVAAPPVDGKANAELLKFLKKRLRIPAGDLMILSGETGRRKRMRISGIPAAELLKKLSGDA